MHINQSHSSHHHSGFTIAQLIIILVIAALLVTSGIVIVTTLHKSSVANGGLTPVTTKNTPTTPAQIDAARAAQNQRQCAAMSPTQKAQMARMQGQSVCATQ